MMDTPGYKLVMQYLDAVHEMERAEVALRPDQIEKWAALGTTAEELETAWNDAITAKNAIQQRIVALLDQTIQAAGE